MRGPLLNYALNNAWANPQADRQHIIRLARVSRTEGDITYSEITMQRYMLPTIRENYHVFVVGQNHPWEWGFGNKYITPVPFDSWVPLTELMEKRQLVANLYLDNGVHLPTTGVYVRLCYDHNIIIAVKDFKRMSLGKNPQVYMRVYNNTYYESDTPETNKTAIQCFGGEMKNKAEVLGWQNRYLELKTQPGLTMAFVNGMWVDDFKPGSYHVNDWVHVLHDRSVYRVVELKVGNLPTFMSEMDKKRKYIFHPAKALNPDNELVYHDDVDFFVVGASGKGVLFHKNLAANVRQLTHNDYSLSVPAMSNISSYHKDFGDSNNFKVYAMMRHGGFENKMVFEHHRVLELYKMKDGDILEAMVHVNSLVPEWTASRLESSDFMRLQGTELPHLTEALAASALGYNASTIVTTDSPLKVTLTPHTNYVDLPDTLMSNATIYEYDKNGSLLGYYFHPTGRRWVTANKECVSIEGYSGEATKSLSFLYGNDDVPLKPTYEARMYRTTWIDGLPNHDTWEDVTNNPEIVVVKDNKIIWKHNKVRYVGLVLFNDKFLGYSFNLNPPDMSYTFAFTYDWPFGGKLSKFPLGDVDIFMNKRSLINGLDYFVNFPRIVICNKEWMQGNSSKGQDFVLRAYGFPTEKMELQPVSEFGWVKSGLLSTNHRFNLRDDRVTRVIVNGGVYDRKDLPWAENAQVGKLGPKLNNINGKPYHVTNVMASVRNSTDYETYHGRDASMDLDNRVSDYLTEKLPQLDIHDPSVGVDKYTLFSPFLNKVIHDIKLRIFIIGANPISDDRLDKMLMPYKWWLDYDPCTKDIDMKYVVIHPHCLNTAISVTPEEYKVLNRIIKIYLNNRVQLSGHLNIAG